MRSFPFTTGGNEDDDDDALTYLTIIRPTYHLYQLILTPMTRHQIHTTCPPVYYY